VESSVEEAQREGHQWSSKVDLNPLMSEFAGVCSGFKRSRIANASEKCRLRAREKIEEAEERLVSVCECTSACVCGCVGALCLQKPSHSSRNVCLHHAEDARCLHHAEDARCAACICCIAVYSIWSGSQVAVEMGVTYDQGWVASTGSRAAGREAQTPRLVGACERQARGFFGGALRCLACTESPA
jgi:hypothetical protein